MWLLISWHRNHRWVNRWVHLHYDSVSLPSLVHTSVQIIKKALMEHPVVQEVPCSSRYYEYHSLFGEKRFIVNLYLFIFLFSNLGLLSLTWGQSPEHDKIFEIIICSYCSNTRLQSSQYRVSHKIHAHDCSNIKCRYLSLFGFLIITKKIRNTFDFWEMGVFLVNPVS